jgi:hypothetical protein
MQRCTACLPLSAAQALELTSLAWLQWCKRARPRRKASCPALLALRPHTGNALLPSPRPAPRAAPHAHPLAPTQPTRWGW